MKILIIIIINSISITIPPGMDKTSDAKDHEEKRAKEKGTVAERAPRVDNNRAFFFFTPLHTKSIPERAEKLRAPP